MIWSILGRRIPLGAIAARSAHLPSLSVVARRTLIATSQFNFPAKAPQGAEKETRKTAEKKASKGERTTTAKRGRPQKNPVEHKEKQPKQKKQKTRIPKTLKPPKRAPGPYVLFYSSYVKSQPKATTLQDVQELSKRAAEIWKGYSIAEKQPFYDENAVRKVQAKQERDEFFRTTSASDLKELNAIRKAQGKTKYHSTQKSSSPASPFILFSNEFRNSPDGQALINETSPTKTLAIRAAIAAADHWKTMSPEEKAPYFERFKKAREEWKAEQATV